MGQYPSPYESGPYADAQSPAGNPYAASAPAYGPGGTPPGGPAYGPGGVPGGPAYGPGAAPGGPAYGPGVVPGGPAYGPGAAPYGPGGPHMPAVSMPAPMFIVPPPDPEEVAEKGRRVTRGLGLGAVVTGTVSVAIQLLVVLGLILMISASDSLSSEAAITAAVFILMGFFLVPMLVLLAWATSFGLSLAACVRANGGGATRQPAHWAGAGGIMGGIMAASVLQGAPAVMLLFALGLYDSDTFSGNTMLVASAVVGLALLFGHIALIVKVRTLGVQVEKQVPYA